MSSPVWPMLAAERATLVDYLPTLSDADWSRPSPSAGWSVAPTSSPTWSREPRRLRSPSSRASCVRASRSTSSEPRGIEQRRDATPKELIEALRSRINAKTVPGSAYLGEIVVHGEDIRRGYRRASRRSSGRASRRGGRLLQEVGRSGAGQETSRRAHAVGDRRRVDDRRRPRGHGSARAPHHGHVRPRVRRPKGSPARVWKGSLHASSPTVRAMPHFPDAWSVTEAHDEALANGAHRVVDRFLERPWPRSRDGVWISRTDEAALHDRAAALDERWALAATDRRSTACRSP